MIADGLKLTTYFGERTRAHGGLLVDALCDCYARHGLAASVLLRGVRGFGQGHRMRSDGLLTLSEDLPILAVAIDTRDRIEAALDDVRELTAAGLVTLERARFATGPLAGIELPPDLADAAKLTIYLGRKQLSGGRPASLVLVDLLHRHGVDGATVLLGVDGTLRGARRRAAFFGRNADVPLMVIAVGSGATIAAALRELPAVVADPVITLEGIRVCKRDGAQLAEPDQAAPGSWQKLMVYTGEQARHAGHPLTEALVRRLRQAGAAGATSARGTWGYHGDHAPHGDRFLSLRRHVPVVTVCIDTPERTRDWFAIIDELTDETGLVTSEPVSVVSRQR